MKLFSIFPSLPREYGLISPSWLANRIVGIHWILYFNRILRLTVFQNVRSNITFYCISEGDVEYYILLYFRRWCGILRFTVFQKAMWNITFYCISEGQVEYYLLLCFRRSSGILYNYCTWMRSIWGFMEQSTFCTMFYYTRFLKILKFHEIFWIFLKIL